MTRANDRSGARREAAADGRESCVDAVQSAAILNALSSEHRVRIVKRLVAQELTCAKPSDCDLTARCCDVAELSHAVDCSLPTLSYHLKELKRAGIVAAERRGRHIFYAVNSRVIRDTLHYILGDT